MTNDGGTKPALRILERRVSNNRPLDLACERQTNYCFAWFKNWSELQKADFVPILAKLMYKIVSPHDSSVAGENKISFSHDSCHSIGDSGLNASTFSPLPTVKSVTAKKSIYQCQVELIQTWFASWSDDQKAYLILRLKEEDGEFYAVYTACLASSPTSSALSTMSTSPSFSCWRTPVKDYFDPGVEHLIGCDSRIASESSPATTVTSDDGGETSGIASADERLTPDLNDKSFVQEDANHTLSHGSNSAVEQLVNDKHDARTDKDVPNDYLETSISNISNLNVTDDDSRLAIGSC